MRNTVEWYQPLRQELLQYVPAGQDFYTFCATEIGLYGLNLLWPNAPAYLLWALMRGYKFFSDIYPNPDPMLQQVYQNMRILLTSYRNMYDWYQALERYREHGSEYTLYDIDPDNASYRQKRISVAHVRPQIYHQALTNPLPFRQKETRTAVAGQVYTFADGDSRNSVRFLEEHIYELPPGHSIKSNKKRPAKLQATWKQLTDTATWMDNRLEIDPADRKSYTYRLKRTELQLPKRGHTELVPTDKIVVNGLMNIVGMVGAGKSTLMDILAVHFARQGRHITLIIGDVASILNKVELFNKIAGSDFRAAPLVGTMNRVNHLNALHKAQYRPGRVDPNPHSGFGYLSTLCLVEELRESDINLQLPYNQAPCHSLTDTKGRYTVCPFVGVCPRHKTTHEMPDANIWIGTVASMIFSRAARPMTPEDIRYAELVGHHSDLVIFDEADLIQIQLDTIFSPSVTLIGGHDSLLGHLDAIIHPALNSTNRRDIMDSEALKNWCNVYDLASVSVNELFRYIAHTEYIREWLSSQFFTHGMLFDKIVTEITGLKTGEFLLDHTRVVHNQANPIDPDLAVYARTLHSAFHYYVDHPTATLDEDLKKEIPNLDSRRMVIGMRDIAQMMFFASGTTATQKLNAAIRWINAHTGSEDVPRNRDLAQKLICAINVAYLTHCLDILYRGWSIASAAFNLDQSYSIALQKPPHDYLALIPSAPQGNVLGYQFDGQTNELKFYRASGVGRWMLLNFHQMWTSEMPRGPHTILLSGTSWARDSARYHIQTKTDAILKPPDEEIENICQSEFIVYPLYAGEDTSKPIYVSGLRGGERLNAIKDIAQALFQRKKDTSEIETILVSLPEGRRRILLLVGSYKEAQVLEAAIKRNRPDLAYAVTRLVANDSEFADDWIEHTGTLPRGEVHRFPETEAQYLIAPLIAIERGHNIITRDSQAAFGAVMFLVRHHPHPKDIGTALAKLAKWAITIEKHSRGWKALPFEELEQRTKHFSEIALAKWQNMLNYPANFAGTEHGSPVRNELVWTTLVTMWQAIGRCVRGGVPTVVYFCDGKFAPESTNLNVKQRPAVFDPDNPDFGRPAPDTPQTSILLAIEALLEPYMIDGPTMTHPRATEKAIVRALYRPLYIGLKNMRGIRRYVPTQDN